jgi:hypothetical protein
MGAPTFNDDDAKGFTDLADLAAQLREHPDLEPLADFTLLRDRGLRTPAFASLRAFLQSAATWSTERARHNAVLVLELFGRLQQTRRLLIHPLREEFLLPVLHDWAQREPRAREPERWLGLLEYDPVRLARALEAAPGDVQVRRALLQLVLARIEDACHHLDQSRLLAEVGEVRADLAQAWRLIDEAPDGDPLSRQAEEVAVYSALLDDWNAYLDDRHGSFPEWCRAHGRDLHLPSRVETQDVEEP